MNCAKANQIDLVELLAVLGYQPAKIRSTDYWYLSPLRHEKEASFKVNRAKNIWYDHGSGKGGKTIDFVMQYFNCSIHEALHKSSLFHQQNQSKISFKNLANASADLIGESVSETAIKIIAEKPFVTDSSLYQYLERRHINIEVANAYCKEVSYNVTVVANV